MQKIRDPFPIIAVILFFVLLLGIVGKMDHEDAVFEAETYCANVHSGMWPDYEGIYKEQCYEGHYKGDR